MVTRTDPPYPATPIKTSSFHIQDARNQLLPSASDSDTPSVAWPAEGARNGFRAPQNQEEPQSSLQPGLKAPQAESSLPLSLQAGAGRDSASRRSSMERSSMERPNGNGLVPESLRPGPPRSSQEGTRTTNPFHRKQQSGQSSSQGGGSSTAAWAGTAPAPPAPPALPPPPPTELLGALSLEPSDPNPWTPGPPPASSAPHDLQGSSEDSATQAWKAAPPVRQPPIPPVPLQSEDRRSSISSQESEDWNDERTGSTGQPESTPEQSVSPVHEEQNVWEENHPEPKSMRGDIAEHVESVTTKTHEREDSSQSSGIIDASPGLTPEHEIDSQTTRQLDDLLHHGQENEEQAPPQPPRPTQSTTFNAARSNAETQKKETYEIKKISWHDVTSPFNPRISPILVQNANGPCPLLALVNALTLSTPADVDTALVETLRSREQVSLGLLLDAVIDELISGRRSDGTQVLPDVSDLYSFLITLHTGMNVNPLFFPPEPNTSVNDPRNSMSHVHPIERDSLLPGTFEETREMKLYGTFSVPLIHGWLPLPGSAAYTALSRSGKSYEDAQNIMFREEELEEKLSQESLSFEEQATLEDISTIKAFLSSNGTQLTTNGLETIRISMVPGSVAILFRNDHFSTLYRHPETMQLLQLVTDMGYAGHDEVVWESLADVNGENCEFLSGDFRIVGNNGGYHSAEEEWTTVQRGSKNKGRSTDTSTDTAVSTDQQYAPPAGPPPSHVKETSEQEDYDLAFALQLQEKEDENLRNDVARQKREAESSRRYIEQQAGGASIPVTSRGGGFSPRGGRSRDGGQGSSISSPVSANTSNRGPTYPPLIPPRREGPIHGAPTPNNSLARRSQPNRPIDPEAGVEVPPPSYEMAASQAAYNPPVNHPAHPSTSPSVAAAAATNQPEIGATPTGRRRGNFSQSNGNVVYAGRGRAGRASSGTLVNSATNANVNGQQGGKGKEPCTMM